MLNIRSLLKEDYISVTDYSEYKPNKSSNGGCYSYTTRYMKTVDGWKVSYSTSADFPYCTFCGIFCDGDCSWCSNLHQFKIISADELEKRLLAADKDENFEIFTKSGF